MFTMVFTNLVPDDGRFRKEKRENQSRLQKAKREDYRRSISTPQYHRFVRQTWSFFLTLDLASGFHQIKMVEKDSKNRFQQRTRAL